MHADGNFLQFGGIKQSFANARLIGDHDHWQTQRGELLEGRLYAWDEEKFRPTKYIARRPAAVYYAITIEEDGGTGQVQPVSRKLHSQQGEQPPNFFQNAVALSLRMSEISGAQIYFFSKRFSSTISQIK